MLTVRPKTVRFVPLVTHLNLGRAGEYPSVPDVSLFMTSLGASSFTLVSGCSYVMVVVFAR